MTLQELSDAYNHLRNAALGRGFTPNVSPQLAQRVGVGWQAWRDWLQLQGPFADIAASVAASEWVDHYRELAAAVKREGVIVPGELRATPVERVEQTARATGSALGVVALAALALAGAVLVIRGRG